MISSAAQRAAKCAIWWGFGNNAFPTFGPICFDRSGAQAQLNWAFNACDHWWIHFPNSSIAKKKGKLIEWSLTKKTEMLPKIGIEYLKCCKCLNRSECNDGFKENR